MTKRRQPKSGNTGRGVTACNLAGAQVERSQLRAGAWRSGCLLSGCVLAALLGRPGLALADSQGSESAVTEARAFGRDALSALSAKRYSEADELFTKAIARFDAPTLHLGRARARVGLGRFLEATADYDVALQGARAGESESFVAARRDAAAERAALVLRTPRLVLIFAAAVSPSVDGKPWPWSSEQPGPLDPGTHLVAAALEPQRFERKVELKETAVERVSIEAAPAAVSPASVAPVSTDSVGTKAPAANVGVEGTELARVEAKGGEPKAKPAVPVGATKSREPQPQTEASSGAGLWISLAATGLLAAGAVVTGIMALDRRSTFQDRNSDPDISKSRKTELRDDAVLFSWINTGFTGGALIAAGVTGYLWFSEPSTPATKDQTARLTPNFGAERPIGFSVVGKF